MKYDTNYAYSIIKLCSFVLMVIVALKFYSILITYIH